MEDQPNMETLDKPKLTIVICGREFRISQSLLLQHPKSLLGRLALDSKGSTPDKCVFERPIVHFKSVLTFYQTGKLHMPRHVCPREFCDELEFWGLSPRQLEKCCFPSFFEFQSDREQIKQFQAILNATTSNNTHGKQSTMTLKSRIWSVVDNRETTLLARGYLVLALTFVCLSLAALSLSTLPSLNEPISVCDLKDFIKHNEYGSDNETSLIIEFMDDADLNCLDTPKQALQRYMGEWYKADRDEIIEKIERIEKKMEHGNSTIDNTDEEYEIEDLEFFLRLNEVNFPDIFHRSVVFFYIDIVVLVFFSLELLVRLVTCPSLCQYFRSILNSLDLLTLMFTFLGFILEEVAVKYKYQDGNIHILGYLRICRVFRLLRVVQHIVAIQVLVHCLKNNYKDILVLLLYVFIGINIFGIMMFFLEPRKNFESIPMAWYWAIITMTTVGYGDLYPKSFGGRVVGSVCALTGVLVIALVIPVFVNNYMSLYRIADLTKREKELRQVKSNNIETMKVRPI